MQPGVWRLTLGEPEAHTPSSVFSYQPAESGLREMPNVEDCPLSVDAITGKQISRGFQVTLPLGVDEQLYGLGLQLFSMNQRGKKKTLRVNSDPVADTGDSHAPVPFYVTTSGYGVLVDTLRYMTVYCGSAARRLDADCASSKPGGAASSAAGAEELYESQARSGDAQVIIDIPSARGVDLYLFAGPDMQQAVQRYNLFSGSGCLPPMWGLGVWYRCKSDFTELDVLAMAEKFRNDGIPCDVIGLEPGWQSHAYSCSHIWGPKFPQPKQMMTRLSEMGLHVNLWTHAFTHPSSPIHEQLSSRSGDFLVWGGLVPDFADPEARRIFADFHKKEHVDLGAPAPAPTASWLPRGASGYKMDECDNSDFIRSAWSFPEVSNFPSGLDGEQMHSAFGRLYQQTIQSIFDGMGRRTYGQVRSSWSLSAALPYVLYSDLYDHKAFIRGVVTSGFSGLLWGPEVRHAVSAEDLIRRIQTVVFSPKAQVNAWYIKNPPWEQWIRNANNADQLHEDREWVTETIKRLFEVRMQFLPYLYSSFVKYHQTGVPPFRALVMEDPTDPNLQNIDDAYMMGDRALVAPVVAGINERDLYLPKGAWRDFQTGERYEGGQSHHFDVPLDKTLVFVKDNSVLPLAQPVQNVSDPALRQITVNVYGSGELGCTLFEDNGEDMEYKRGQMNTVRLAWDSSTQSAHLARSGNVQAPRYEVGGWNQIS